MPDDTLNIIWSQIGAVTSAILSHMILQVNTQFSGSVFKLAYFCMNNVTTHVDNRMQECLLYIITIVVIALLE